MGSSLTTKAVTVAVVVVFEATDAVVGAVEVEDLLLSVDEAHEIEIAEMNINVCFMRYY